MGSATRLNLAPPANLGLRQEEILKGDAATKNRRVCTALSRVEGAARRNASAAGDRARNSISSPRLKRPERPRSFRFRLKFETIAETRRTGPAARDSERWFTPSCAMLRSKAAELSELAKVHGRVLGATGQEIGGRREAAVTAALKHPLLDRARKSKLCRRELPVFLKLEGNRILEGVIDLAFEENGCWHVVDFKTDAEIGPNRKRYENQLRWYCLALARLNKMPVEAHLLSI